VPRGGDLAERSLARLLMDLYGERWSGELQLSRERIEKAFLLSKGLPFHLESNVPSESLKALPSRRPAGSKALLLALQERLRRGLVECFAWPAGRFALGASAPPRDGSEALALHPYGLIQEGIEAHWSPERVYRELEPSMKLYPCGAQGLERVAARLRRDQEVERLLACLDGEHSLWQALQAAPTPAALAAAWVLDAAGALRYAEHPRRGASEPATSIEIVVAHGAAASATEREGAAAPEAGASRRPRAAATARPDRARLAAEIEVHLEALVGADCYQVLGVSRQADAASIKKAYMQAARAYHPDVLSRSGLDAEARARGSRLFGEIAKAYARLSNPEERRRYDAGLDGEAEGIDVERLASAERLFRKGEVLLHQGNFRGALQFLEPAVELWPAEAAYQAALGWALYKKSPSEPQRARRHLERAVEIDARDGVSLFRLGLVLRSLGEEASSLAALDHARRIDPGVDG